MLTGAFNKTSCNWFCVQLTWRTGHSTKAVSKRFTYRMNVTNQGCVPLWWSGSGSVLQDRSDHCASMNWCIHDQRGFIGCFDARWSGWSWITDPDPDHLKETHLKSLLFHSKAMNLWILLTVSPCFQARWDERNLQCTLFWCIAKLFVRDDLDSTFQENWAVSKVTRFFFC